MLWESRSLIGFSLLSVCYWKVCCLFHGVFCLCAMGKSVIHLSLSALWVYGKVGCSFDKLCCLCVMGTSDAHLINFAACV